MRASLDRLAGKAARALLTWAARQASGPQRPWLEAARAELDVIEGGRAQLAWAVSGLRLARFGRGSVMTRMLGRYGILLLDILAVALAVALALRLTQRYHVLAAALAALSVIGMFLGTATLYALGHAVNSRMKRAAVSRHPGWRQRRGVTSALGLAAGLVTLCLLAALSVGAWATLDQLAAQGPPTATVTASAADHAQVEAELARLGKKANMPNADSYLTTSVTVGAINGVPLDQWLRQLDPAGRMRPQDLQHRLGKFASIQGFELGRGQLPNGSQIGFSSGLGAGAEHNLGRDGETVAQAGRLLETRDANSLNVLIPVEAGWGASDPVCCVDFYNGDTITVQGQHGGPTLTLHVVGVYEEDGASTNLFGGILADAGVVRTLSAGAPTYAYALRLDANQRDTLAQRLRATVPGAQVTALTGAGAQVQAGSFTDLTSEEVWWIPSHWGLAGQIVAIWSLLAAILVVINVELRRRLRRSGQPRPPALPPTLQLP